MTRRVKLTVSDKRIQRRLALSVFLARSIVINQPYGRWRVLSRPVAKGELGQIGIMQADQIPPPLLTQRTSSSAIREVKQSDGAHTRSGCGGRR